MFSTPATLRRHPIRWTLAALTASAALFVLPSVAGTAPNSTTFSLHPSPATLACVKGATGSPTATATVTRGAQNDALTLTLHNFKPNLAFDLFTVQRSNQRADGTPVPNFTNFGLAWYQSDVQVGSTGSASVTIRTILLDQIFGFDPDKSLAPTNTFHVGFWFNRPQDAAPCGFTGFTPFNGEHHAGPVAFITRPLAATGLGPLCVNFNTTTHRCNP